MYEIDFNFEITKASGEEAEGPLRKLKANILLATFLETSKTGREKYMEWAVKLYATGILILDNADRKKLLKAVESSQMMNAAAVPIMTRLEEAQEIPEAEKMD